jgi:hypothetical protein
VTLLAAVAFCLDDRHALHADATQCFGGPPRA